MKWRGSAPFFCRNPLEGANPFFFFFFFFFAFFLTLLVLTKKESKQVLLAVVSQRNTVALKMRRRQDTFLRFFACFFFFFSEHSIHARVKHQQEGLKRQLLSPPPNSRSQPPFQILRELGRACQNKTKVSWLLRRVIG